MDIYSQLSKAFAAHGFWKMWLIQAINTGETDLTVENARQDERCGFGRWLQSLPDDIKATVYWQKVPALHNRFHHDAAHVLELALHGQRTDAMSEVAQDGGFTESSRALTHTIMDWKAALD
ncbi:MAG: hypothetical protein FJ189_02280 [Gammaproteobacteria bacterium]|nr:hypothetical protein [Gammaproteobacteria bacterium]